MALRCTIFLVCLLSFPSSSLSLFTVVYQPLWLKITQFPKYNVRRLVSLEKEQKLSLRYGIETFSKKRLGRDLYETKYVLGWYTWRMREIIGTRPFSSYWIKRTLSFSRELHCHGLCEIRWCSKALFLFLKPGSQTRSWPALRLRSHILGSRPRLPQLAALCSLQEHHNVCRAFKFSKWETKGK